MSKTKVTLKELNKAIIQHKLWLKNGMSGKKLMYENCLFKNLCLNYKNLTKSIFKGCVFLNCELEGIIFTNAELTNCDFYNVQDDYLSFDSAILKNISFTNISSKMATFQQAKLNGVSAHNCTFRECNFTYTEFKDSDFCRCDLSYSFFEHTKIRKTDFTGANLYYTLFSKNQKARIGRILKRKMTGYKKLSNGRICTLCIPKGAIVFSINNNECRTNKAIVLSGEGYSSYDPEFTYSENKYLEISNFDMRYNIEGSTGIHFFKTLKEAKAHRI